MARVLKNLLPSELVSVIDEILCKEMHAERMRTVLQYINEEYWEMPTVSVYKTRGGQRAWSNHEDKCHGTCNPDGTRWVTTHRIFDYDTEMANMAGEDWWWD